MRNSQGKPVIDRLFNTVSLLDVYMGKEGVPSDAVQWDIDNPNDLELHLPGDALSAHQAPPGHHALIEPPNESWLTPR